MDSSGRVDATLVDRIVAKARELRLEDDNHGACFLQVFIAGHLLSVDSKPEAKAVLDQVLFTKEDFNGDLPRYAAHHALGLEMPREALTFLRLGDFDERDQFGPYEIEEYKQRLVLRVFAASYLDPEELALELRCVLNRVIDGIKIDVSPWSRNAAAIRNAIETHTPLLSYLVF
jgi:hypothetical protein